MDDKLIYGTIELEVFNELKQGYNYKTHFRHDERERYLTDNINDYFNILKEFREELNKYFNTYDYIYKHYDAKREDYLVVRYFTPPNEEHVKYNHVIRIYQLKSKTLLNTICIVLGNTKLNDVYTLNYQIQRNLYNSRITNKILDYLINKLEELFQKYSNKNIVL